MEGIANFREHATLYRRKLVEKQRIAPPAKKEILSGKKREIIE
jgi:hypothetical protein